MVQIGASVQGRPIRGLGLSTEEGTDKIGILIVGAQHARDVGVAASSALWIADRLTDGADPEVAALLESVPGHRDPRALANPTATTTPGPPIACGGRTAATTATVPWAST